MGFKDISTIIKRIEGQADNNINISNKSKPTQALYLFEQGKKPIDIAVELDISYNEVFELQQEYYALKELYDLAFVCMEIGNDLSSIINQVVQNYVSAVNDISRIMKHLVLSRSPWKSFAMSMYS